MKLWQTKVCMRTLYVWLKLVAWDPGHINTLQKTHVDRLAMWVQSDTCQQTLESSGIKRKNKTNFGSKGLQT
jgi:hypothetical protein